MPYHLGNRSDGLTYIPWTAWENAFIRAHYPRMTIAQISRALNRPYVATKGHVRYMRSKGDLNGNKRVRGQALGADDSRGQFLHDMERTYGED